MTCLIVDDEPLARKLVASHVSKIDGLELIGECNNAIEAGNFLRSRSVGLLFLDIQMPEISGLQFVRTLKHPPAIILTTAYRDFAPESYDLDVVDYLLKPISFERLTKAVNKFFDRYQTTGLSLKDGDAPSESFVYLKAERKLHRISLKEIVYVESLDEYVKVYLIGRVLITRESISSLEQKLPPGLFIRIHRSFIISSRHIKTVSSESIEVEKRALPFGRAYKKSALAALSLKEG